MENKKIMVSVSMVTYNHEKYIVQAIEGVLMQRTTFPVELIIGEDCSTDNTRKICLEYKAKYSDKIKLLLPEKNLGMMQNNIATLQACTGKYIALCEGDDYWTDPYKLQKQVDFLEANPDFNLCVHQTDILENGVIEKKELRFDRNRKIFSVKDYIYDLFFHTSSVVFRNIEIPSYLNNPNILQGDIALFLGMTLDKKIYFMTESMSVYRNHEHGITKSSFYKSKLNTYKSLLLIMNNFNDYSERKYNKFIWLKKQLLFSLLFIYHNDPNKILKFFAKGYYYVTKILLRIAIKVL
jgi:glycosyltransferase involved in cell wall biosynthesis